MDEIHFLALVDKVKRSKPFWFEGETDPAATDKQIDLSEAEIGVQFPIEYRQFLKRFGGGYFGHANVFSVNPDSEWNINVINSRSRLPYNFIAVSDDQAGGFYGFERNGGHLSEAIFYIYLMEGDAIERRFNSLFEFLRSIALGIVE